MRQGFRLIDSDELAQRAVWPDTFAARWTLNGVSVRRALDGGGEVRRHAHLLEHDVERGIAVESLDLAILHIEEVRARNVDLCSRLAGPH